MNMENAGPIEDSGGGNVYPSQNPSDYGAGSVYDTGGGGGFVWNDIGTWGNAASDAWNDVGGWYNQNVAPMFADANLSAGMGEYVGLTPTDAALVESYSEPVNNVSYTEPVVTNDFNIQNIIAGNDFVTPWNPTGAGVGYGAGEIAPSFVDYVNPFTAVNTISDVAPAQLAPGAYEKFQSALNENPGLADSIGAIQTKGMGESNRWSFEGQQYNANTNTWESSTPPILTALSFTGREMDKSTGGALMGALGWMSPSSVEAAPLPQTTNGPILNQLFVDNYNINIGLLVGSKIWSLDPKTEEYQKEMKAIADKSGGKATVKELQDTIDFATHYGKGTSPLLYKDGVITFNTSAPTAPTNPPAAAPGPAGATAATTTLSPKLFFDTVLNPSQEQIGKAPAGSQYNVDNPAPATKDVVYFARTVGEPVKDPGNKQDPAYNDGFAHNADGSVKYALNYNADGTININRENQYYKQLNENDKTGINNMVNAINKGQIYSADPKNVNIQSTAQNFNNMFGSWFTNDSFYNPVTGQVRGLGRDLGLPNRQDMWGAANMYVGGDMSGDSSKLIMTRVGNDYVPTTGTMTGEGILAMRSVPGSSANDLVVDIGSGNMSPLQMGKVVSTINSSGFLPVGGKTDNRTTLPIDEFIGAGKGGEMGYASNAFIPVTQSLARGTPNMDSGSMQYGKRNEDGTYNQLVREAGNVGADAWAMDSKGNIITGKDADAYNANVLRNEELKFLQGFDNPGYHQLLPNGKIGADTGELWKARYAEGGTTAYAGMSAVFPGLNAREQDVMIRSDYLEDNGGTVTVHPWNMAHYLDPAQDDHSRDYPLSEAKYASGYRLSTPEEPTGEVTTMTSKYGSKETADYSIPAPGYNIGFSNPFSYFTWTNTYSTGADPAGPPPATNPADMPPPPSGAVPPAGSTDNSFSPSGGPSSVDPNTGGRYNSANYTSENATLPVTVDTSNLPATVYVDKTTGEQIWYDSYGRQQTGAIPVWENYGFGYNEDRTPVSKCGTGKTCGIVQKHTRSNRRVTSKSGRKNISC